MEELLADARRLLSAVVHCEVDDIVLVNNATTGTNAVLRDLIFSSGDAILTLSTTYGAVDLNVQYHVDMERMRGNELHHIKVEVPVPSNDDDIIKILKDRISKAENEGKKIRIAIIDTVSSRPALRFPWQKLVEVLRGKQILSLVCA